MILERLDELRAEQVRQGAEQVRQGVVLERHEQRSTTLEAMHGDLAKRIAPLETSAAMWAGAGRALALIGTGAGIVAALWRVLG